MTGWSWLEKVRRLFAGTDADHPAPGKPAPPLEDKQASPAEGEGDKPILPLPAATEPDTLARLFRRLLKINSLRAEDELRALIPAAVEPPLPDDDWVLERHLYHGGITIMLPGGKRLDAEQMQIHVLDPAALAAALYQPPPPPPPWLEPDERPGFPPSPATGEHAMQGRGRGWSWWRQHRRRPADADVEQEPTRAPEEIAEALPRKPEAAAKPRRRWKVDPAIAVLRKMWPPHGLPPNETMPVVDVLGEIEKYDPSLEDKFSEDTVDRALKAIRESLQK